MIKKIVKDTFFLQQKAQPATKKDLWIGQDLQDTLAYYRDSCLGLAANMIGENKKGYYCQHGLCGFGDV